MATVQPKPTNATPDFKYLGFEYNPETGFFEMAFGEPGFLKVPPELKIEPVQRRDIIKATQVCRGRIEGGKYLFFTGIVQTGFSGWYFGDFYEIKNGIKRNSFILFHFLRNNRAFEMYFFNHFKLYPKSRGRFITKFITEQKKEPRRVPDRDSNLFNLNGKATPFSNDKDTAND